jgi:ornithine carbamoyltransferase
VLYFQRSRPRRIIEESMIRHFLCLKESSPDELRYLLSLAARLKQELAEGGNRPILRGKVLGMVFQKPSLRTRVSFDMAMRHLGGDALYISPDTWTGSWRGCSSTDTSRNWRAIPRSR